MAFKIVILCASAFLIQTIEGQCVRPAPSAPSCDSILVSDNPLAVTSNRRSSSSSSSSSSCGCASIQVSDNGGPLAVTSIGPISPSGIGLATELGLSGDLDISGALPYLSAVAFDGQFDTSGSAPVSYGCGDCVAITEEISSSGYSIAPCGCGGTQPIVRYGNITATAAALSGDGDGAAGGCAAAERYGTQNRYRASYASGAAGIDRANCADLSGAMSGTLLGSLPALAVPAGGARTGPCAPPGSGVAGRQRAPVVAARASTTLAKNGLSTRPQSISAQSCGRRASAPAPSCGCPSRSGSVAISSSGGDLPVTSVGPISSSGIAFAADVDLSGTLDVSGELPFLSAVEFQGSYDTSGSACVDYSCGSCGNVAITNVIGGRSGSSSGCGCRS